MEDKNSSTFEYIKRFGSVIYGAGLTSLACINVAQTVLFGLGHGAALALKSESWRAKNTGPLLHNAMWASWYNGVDAMKLFNHAFMGQHFDWVKRDELHLEKQSKMTPN